MDRPAFAANRLLFPDPYLQTDDLFIKRLTQYNFFHYRFNSDRPAAISSSETLRAVVTIPILSPFFKYAGLIILINDNYKLVSLTQFTNLHRAVAPLRIIQPI